MQKTVWSKYGCLILLCACGGPGEPAGAHFPLPAEVDVDHATTPDAEVAEDEPRAPDDGDVDSGVLDHVAEEQPHAPVDDVDSGPPRDADTPDAGTSDSGQPVEPRPVTYWQDIEPIMEEHCVLCHRPLGIGGFPLTTFQEVFLEASGVEQATTSLFMPPCEGAEPGTCGLNIQQQSAIRRWVAQGRAEGPRP